MKEDPMWAQVRTEIGDGDRAIPIFVSPMYEWLFVPKTGGVARHFLGWHAFEINARGYASYPVPVGSMMGGSVGLADLFKTQEEAIQAAVDVKFKKEVVDGGKN